MPREAFLRDALTAAQTAHAAGAPINPAIAAAQAALESNWGQSQLARDANNLKGIKAGSSWRGDTIELPTREWREADGTWYTTVARWRKYRDWAHSFADYGELIARVYPVAASKADDARAFLEALIAGDKYAYATDPNYVQKVWSIVEEYALLDLQPASDRLLVILAPDNTELAQVPIPAGLRVRTITTVDLAAGRVYVRPEITEPN